MDKDTVTQREPDAAEPPRDQLFAAPRRRVGDFDFGKDTAPVFDDMLERSVPFYVEIQKMIGELVTDFAAEGTAIYDLGCSTGTTFLQIAQTVPRDRNVRYVGVDSSPEMLELARRKLTESGFDRPFELECADLNAGVRIDGASVVLMVLTLQFIRPLYRQRLIRSIHEGLTENGALILVEKVLGENSTFNRLFIHHYYEMKRENGYSELEIAQKREALENVLIPYRFEENKELLREQGFRHIDVFFKWYNFCAMIATK
jgi:tRNA (cmo5U34)-methyltransferase